MVQCGLFHEFDYVMFQKDPTEAAKYYEASYKKGDLCGLAQFGVFFNWRPWRNTEEHQQRNSFN